MYQKGFTIVELIVVLLLVAIVAIIAVPRWASSPKLEGQLQQLQSDLRYAQNLAMTHGERFRVNFTLPSTYNISDKAGAAVTNPSTGMSSTALTNGVIISGLTNLPNNLIAFDGKGIPYTDATASTALTVNAVITLKVDDITRSIIIAPETGSMTTQ